MFQYKDLHLFPTGEPDFPFFWKYLTTLQSFSWQIKSFSGQTKCVRENRQGTPSFKKKIVLLSPHFNKPIGLEVQCKNKLISYYPFKKYVESEHFFFLFAVQAWSHLSPCLNDHSYRWVVNLLQLVFKRAGSKQKCRKWMS